MSGRSIIVKLRLSKAELADLDARASEVGLNRSDYLRASASVGPLRARPRPANAPAINREALAQLSRAGNLLNQIARYAHSGALGNAAESDLKAALTDLRQAANQLQNKAENDE